MGFVIGLICAGVFFLVLYMVLLYLFYSGPLMAVFMLSPILCVVSFFIVKSFMPRSYEKMAKKVLEEATRKDEEELQKKRSAIIARVEKKVAENNQKLAQTRVQLEQVNKRIYSFQVIPAYYKSAETTKIIEAYIRSGRADSVKQAINLYEKEKLTAEVLDAEYRASKTTSAEESRRKAFRDVVSTTEDEEFAHERKMREHKQRRQSLEMEHEILYDELERGRKINKYPQEDSFS